MTSAKFTIQAYYKGTAFPAEYHMTQSKWDHTQNEYKSVLENGLRTGVSLNQQALDYKEQLDKIEADFTDIFGKKPSQVTDKHITQIEKRSGMSWSRLMVLWYMNIYCLLKLRKIQNDNMNGWLYMQEHPKNPDTIIIHMD